MRFISVGNRPSKRVTVLCRPHAGIASRVFGLLRVVAVVPYFGRPLVVPRDTRNSRRSFRFVRRSLRERKS